MKKEYDILFAPCKIGSLEIKNRFVVPAMSFTDVITWSNHSQTENKIEDFLIRKAKDGVGCFVFGCLYVFNQTNVNDWLYNHPDLFKDIPALMDTLHSYGTKAIQQLGFGAGKAYIMPPVLQDKYDEDKTIKKNADMMRVCQIDGLLKEKRLILQKNVFRRLYMELQKRHIYVKLMELMVWKYMLPMKDICWINL